MSTLGDVAAQLLDKLADLVVGPVQGTITATCDVGTVTVPQGQLATLPDGRKVRITKGGAVTNGFPLALPARLLHLSPSYPAASNFAPVAAATIATWASPPTNIAATGTTSVFAVGERSASLKVGGIVEVDDFDAGLSSFSAGVQGTVQGVLASPTVTRIGGENITSRLLCEAVWRLRFSLVELASQHEPRARARELFDDLVASLQGATAGDDVVRIRSWTKVREANWPNTWEATLLTRVTIDGRVYQANDEDFIDVLGTVTVPGDDAGNAPFQVIEDADTTIT